MLLCHLRDKLEKLFFLNNLICDCGGESIDALYVLEDELKELEKVYEEVADQLEECI